MSGLVWSEYLQDLRVYLRHCVSNFQAGGIQSCVRFWQSLTTDSFLLQFVSNCYEIEFNETPVQASVPRAIQFSPEETVTMDTELQTLLRFGVIVECDRSDGDFVSNVFLRPKPDGTSRVILNLRQLNDDVEYRHFKMASLQQALDFVNTNDYMAVIDWKFAYFSCPVAVHHRKFHTFTWKGKNFCFTCLPNGLSSAPRIFTKLTKPVFAALRRDGYMNVPYIDDTFLTSHTLDKCR